MEVTIYAGSGPGDSTGAELVRSEINEGKCQVLSDVRDIGCISITDGSAQIQVVRSNIQVGIGFRLAALLDQRRILAYADMYAATVSESIHA